MEMQEIVQILSTEVLSSVYRRGFCRK